ncbi:MAG: hypothetical protein KDB27_12000, partial [Planctomycetales bacterium]|nr:hypothetical protein [Planctomycetales bacterium]
SHEPPTADARIPPSRKHPAVPPTNLNRQRSAAGPHKSFESDLLRSTYAPRRDSPPTEPRVSTKTTDSLSPNNKN